MLKIVTNESENHIKMKNIGIYMQFINVLTSSVAVHEFSILRLFFFFKKNVHYIKFPPIFIHSLLIFLRKCIIRIQYYETTMYYESDIKKLFYITMYLSE